MFMKVLVALDGSALSEASLPYVIDIARRFKSQVHVVSVISESEQGLALDRVFEAYIGRIADNLKEHNISIQHTLLAGDPSTRILEFSEKNGVDLIVITTLGKGGVSRWNVGSVAGKLAVASSAPLLLVPVKNVAPPAGPCFTNVLVPVDLSDLGASALPCVEAIAAMTSYAVRLLNVEPPPYQPTKLTEKYYRETAEFLSENTRNYLEDLASQLKQRGVEASYDMLTGDPAETILEYARTRKVNLIAVSTHGRTGIVRWAMGSVTNKVLHETEVPLLLVRPPVATCPVFEGK